MPAWNSPSPLSWWLFGSVVGVDRERSTCKMVNGSTRASQADSYPIESPPMSRRLPIFEDPVSSPIIVITRTTRWCIICCCSRAARSSGKLTYHNSRQIPYACHYYARPLVQRSPVEIVVGKKQSDNCRGRNQYLWRRSCDSRQVKRVPAQSAA